MSRIGRLPIPVPTGVEVDIKDNTVMAKGSQGTISRTFHSDMSIVLDNGQLLVSRPSDEKRHRALHGLTRSLLANMIEGVHNGFQRELEIVGAGYRARAQGENVVLQVGYSHPVEISPLPGISLVVEGTNRVKVCGIDKEVVGEMAAKIRAVRPPDAYKGKGIRYSKEHIRLKPGKKAVGKKG